MRLLLCKIQCPFICFCKPSAAHLYTSAPLKLESSPHVVSSGLGFDKEAANAKTKAPKSCIRKPHDGNKRVQWMDHIGKQLAEIKEFESSETGDTDYEEDSSRCVCIILWFCYSGGSFIYISPAVMNVADTRQKLKGDYYLFMFSCLDPWPRNAAAIHAVFLNHCTLQTATSFVFGFHPMACKTSLGPTSSRLLSGGRSSPTA